MEDYCCPEFERAVASKAIEWGEDDAGWSVQGCCYHCYMIVQMVFCPFCGKRLEAPATNGQER